MGKSLVILCIIINTAIAALPNRFPRKDNNQDAISSLIKKYKRPLTILEISENSADYALSACQQYDAICVVLLLHDKNTQSIIETITNNNLKKVVLLQPRNMTYDDFETLGRCEHFDIVIVHDFSYLCGQSYPEYINAFLQLGDFIFLQTNWENMPQLLSLKNKKIVPVSSNGRGTISLYSTKKKGLELARFTQFNRPRTSNLPYKITSNFEEKLFYKDALEKPIEMVPGINLITFIMLRGKYPTDQMIYNNITAMKKMITYHNDLMVGNMIVQGQKLVPIDFKDKRRNANMDRCIQRALTLFNGDNSRLKNPYGRIQEYYKKK